MLEGCFPQQPWPWQQLLEQVWQYPHRVKHRDPLLHPHRLNDLLEVQQPVGGFGISLVLRA